MMQRLMMTSAAVLLGSVVAPSAQQPTFSAKREAVRVDTGPTVGPEVRCEALPR